MAPNLFNRSIASISTFILVFGLTFPVGFFSAVPLTKAATYTVSNTNDSGAGSLRQAITDANTSGGADIINFDALTGTVTLASDLPNITEQVTINGHQATSFTIDATGRTQCLRFESGATGSTVTGLTCDGGNTGTNGIYVESGADINIGGTGANENMTVDDFSTNGIYVLGESTILATSLTSNNVAIKLSGTSATEIGDGTSAGRNYIYSNSNYGIEVASSTGYTIDNNYIGTSDGTTDEGNGGNGIQIGITSSGGTISDNLISGNTLSGIRAMGGSNTIQGNTIGLDSAGNAMANEAQGVYLGSASNIVGGSGSLKNIISGNGAYGVYIADDSNLIDSNYIGLNAAGDTARPNTSGIFITTGAATDNEILNNYISGNTSRGIYIASSATSNDIWGNKIGLAADGSTDIGNGTYGIEIQTDSNQIGDDTDGAKRNYISGNGSHGIYINGGDSNIIERNTFGLATDDTTKVTNDADAIHIHSGAQNNSIGGATTNMENTIAAADSNSGIELSATAGNGNHLRRNTFITGTSVAYHTLDGGNESITAPSITGMTISSASGTSAANNTVELYSLDGSSVSTVAFTTANGSGEWSITGLDFGSATKAYATQTTASNSTSIFSGEYDIPSDVTAPTEPVVTSHTEGQLINTTSPVISGTKEADSNIKVNDTEEVALDALTTWSYTATLTEGANALVITSEDAASNESTGLTLNLTVDTTAPSAPTVTSTLITNGSAYTISLSGGEANANLYIDGVDSGTDFNADGIATHNLTLTEGANTYSLQVQDEAGNLSTATNTTITYNVNHGQGSSSSGKNYSSANDKRKDKSTTEKAEEIIEETIEEAVEVVEEVVEELDVEEAVEEVIENIDEIAVVETPAAIEQAPENDFNDLSANMAPIVEAIVGPTIITPIETVDEDAPLLIISQDLEENSPAQISLDTFNQVFELENFSNSLISKMPEAGADNDNDGISDLTEFKLGLSTDTDDTDGDGITDLEEIESGFDPVSYDTDGDTIPDHLDTEPKTYNSVSVTAGSIGVSFDSDGDGLSDIQEQHAGSDPNNADSDGDGILDSEEVLNYGTDPNQSNTQADLFNLSIPNQITARTLQSGTQSFPVSGPSEETVKLYGFMDNDMNFMDNDMNFMDNDMNFMDNDMNFMDNDMNFMDNDMNFMDNDMNFMDNDMNFMDNDMNLVEMGETVLDEAGKGLMVINNLEAGEHTVFLATTNFMGEITDFSAPKTLSVAESTSSNLGGLELSIGEDQINESTGARIQSQGHFNIALPEANKAVEIVFHFQSAVLSQTLIADADGRTVTLEPNAVLPPGNHTLTVAAIDLETNEQTASRQIVFNVNPNTTAFVSGQVSEENSPWAIIGGAVSILVALSALAIFMRKRKTV